MSGADAIKSVKGSGDEWLTPLPLWTEIRERYFGGNGKIFDPCPSPSRLLPGTYAKAEGFNSLEQKWDLPAFVNPPFSHIYPWVDIASKRNGKVVMLLPVRSDQPWWYNYAKFGKVVFIRGRVNYENPESGKTAGASFPSCLLIFGMFWDGLVEYWYPECHQNRRKVLF